MADSLYSVDIPQGGSGAVNPGAAQFLGLRQELLRQAGLARQAQLDEEQRQRDALSAEVQKANIASLTAQREGQTQLNTEKATAMAADQFAKTHGVGAALSPDEKTVALHLFGTNAVKDQPAVAAAPADAGVSAEAPVSIAAPAADLLPDAPLQDAHPAVAAQPASTTFAGSEAQQEKKTAQDLAHSILNGDYDTGDSDVNQEFKGWALSTLMTGKATTLPAGALHPKTQTEKDSTRAYNALVMEALGKPVAPEDKVFAAEWRKNNPTEATKQADRLQGLHITIGAAKERQQDNFANAAQKDAVARLDKEYTDLNLPRLAKLADTLKTPGGVNDVVATPELLSAMAGGQGAGLRMSQAELNMIQNARPLLDSLVIKGGNILGINKNGFAALTDQQREQMRQLLLEVAHNNLAIGQNIIDTQTQINGLPNPTQKDIYGVLDARKQHEQDLFGERIGVTPGKDGETPEQRKARLRKAAGLL